MSVTPLPTNALIAALSVRDLTDPTQGPHALQLLVEDAIKSLSAAWPSQVRLIRTGPVVAVEDCYDRLGYSPDAVARDVRYSRYVGDDCMLRSHTSAGVPPALRRLAADPEAPDDVLIALPGICHRRDSIDRLHTGTPHQLDLWRVRRDGRRLDHTDLSGMVGLLLDTLVPGRHWRWNVARHPYTVDGREVEVIDGDHPVELAECGLAAPHVLSGAGLDPNRWSGLALGIGMDRLLMLRKGIPDIRLLRSDDPRVAGQMLDLSPYRPVSALPPARRDLSVAVDPSADAETLGDRVRDALGADADLVEEVTVLSATPYDDVPPVARERLGIRPDQVNVLLRVVLRAADRTLTADEVNTLRDRLYHTLHEGVPLIGAATHRSP